VVAGGFRGGGGAPARRVWLANSERRSGNRRVFVRWVRLAKMQSSVSRLPEQPKSTSGGFEKSVPWYRRSRFFQFVPPRSRGAVAPGSLPISSTP
jgi:hypothetical protein